MSIQKVEIKDSGIYVIAFVLFTLSMTLTITVIMNDIHNQTIDLNQILKECVQKQV